MSRVGSEVVRRRQSPGPCVRRKIVLYLAADCDSISQPRTTLRSSFREKEFEFSPVDCGTRDFRRARAVYLAGRTAGANRRQHPPAADESGHLARPPHAQAPRRESPQTAPHHV